MPISRLEHLRRLLKKHSLDLILVYSSSSDSRFFRWITGAPCRSGCNYLAVREDTLMWVELSYHVSGLPSAPAASISPVDEVHEIPMKLAHITQASSRVGVLGEAPFWHLEHVRADLVVLRNEGDALLLVKSSEEIQELAQLAARLVSDIECAASELIVGTTEQASADILRGLLHAKGGREAFPTSIVSGERLKVTTLGAPTTRVLSPTDAICIDCGIESRALFSDCTRMYFMQESPLIASYEQLCVAHRNVIAQIVPGITFGDIARLFDQELASQGFVEHNLRLTELGHGIGFALHESPFLLDSHSEKVEIVPGMVFTLEPEITVEGYQIRVEDMVAVNQHGAVILTSAT